jgi:hypoxanthine phosphoribosyltransferase
VEFYRFDLLARPTPRPMRHDACVNQTPDDHESGVSNPGDDDSADIGDLGPTLFSSQEIADRVNEIGRRIGEDYSGREPLLVGLLKGAFVFMSDLARSISLPVEMDFMSVSSYGDATESSGVVRILKDLDEDLAGRDVIIVEDIIDSGLTLDYVRSLLAARSPASLAVVALLKRADAAFDEVDYVGFEIGDEFVVGYGLDAGQRYRNLAYIASVA